MIRVNLLPSRRDTQKRVSADAGQIWLLAIMGALVIEAVVLIFFHRSKTAELTEIVNDNNEKQEKIDNITRQLAKHEEIKAKLKSFRDREAAIKNLQDARTGPTAVLLELSRILSPGRGPTTDAGKMEQLKRENPTAMPNKSWDPRRLWLTAYAESERVVKITGLARDGEDVSEFVRRLTVSEYFGDIRLLPASKERAEGAKIELVKFELSARARY